MSAAADAAARAALPASLLACAVMVAACGEPATLPVSAGTGPQPELPAPRTSLIPTVHIAPARGGGPPAGRAPRGARSGGGGPPRPGGGGGGGAAGGGGGGEGGEEKKEKTK